MQNGCHSKCIRMNMLNGDGNFSREIVLFFIVSFKALQEKFKKKIPLLSNKILSWTFFSY